MSKRKWLIVMALVITMVITTAILPGCTSAQTSATTSAETTAAAETTASETTAAAETTAANADGKIVIGEIIFEGTHPYQQAHAKWAEAYAKELGIEIIIVDGKTSPEVEAAGIEDLISKGVDGIIVQPVDGTAISSSINTAQAAGIPVVTFFEPATQAQCPHVDINEYTAAFEMGVYAAKKWDSFFPNTQIKIGAIDFPTLKAVHAYRTTAFVYGVMTEKPDTELVASLDGKGIRDASFTAGEDLLTSHPEVNMVYGINDDSSLGALAAYEAAGRGLAVDGVPQTELFVGTGGSEAEQLKIADPKSAEKITMALDPQWNAQTCIDLLLKVIKGEVDMKSIRDNTATSDVIIDYYRWPIEKIQAFITEKYFSTTNLKEKLGL